MHVLAQAAEATLATPPIDWRAIAPELALTGAGVVLLLVVAWFPDARRTVLAALTLVGLAVAAGLTAWNWGLARPAFGGAVALDGLTRYARVVLLASGALATLMAAQEGEQQPDSPPEVFPLLTFALVGMVMLAAAADLLVVFIALEILSLSLYIMAGATRRLAAEEAAMKYFLLGAFASAFLLYGIALTYGATGTTRLLGIAHASGDPTINSTLLLAGAGLLAVGLCFKVSAVPFHMWTPDVYQGAPTAVTAFMAAATKAAGFAAFLRVFGSALGGLAGEWRPVIAAVAVATMLVGSILAVVQSDLKRMLAYSSVSHAGYLLIGVAAAASVRAALPASMFYLLAYAFTVMGAFMVIQYASSIAPAEREPEPEALTAPKPTTAPVIAGGAVDRADATVAGRQPGDDGDSGNLDRMLGERASLDDYRGFGRRHPWPGALLSVFLFSLAGIPPLSGFWAKYYVFQAGVDAGLTWLVVVAVASSVISAFFYLRVVVVAFLQEPQGAEPAGRRAPLLGVALAVAGLATVLIGLAPQVLISAAQSAGRILGA